MRTDTSTPGPAAGRLTRRAALAGIGAATAVAVVAACTGPHAQPTVRAVGDDPLGALYTETTALVATYDHAMTGVPELVPLVGQLREEHRLHAVALAALIGIADPEIPPGPAPSGTVLPAPSPSGAPRPPAPTPSSSAAGEAAAARAALSAAEKTAQQHAAAACLSAPADRVAVLASIAACRATHVAALR